MGISKGQTFAAINMYDEHGIYRSAITLDPARKVHFDTVALVRKGLTTIEMELHSEEPNNDVIIQQVDLIVHSLAANFTNADLSMITAGLVFGSSEEERNI